MRSVYWGEGAERVGWGTLAFSWGAGGLLYHDGATKMKWWRLWCSVKPHGGSHASWFMVRHQAQASDYSLFGSQRGVECSLSFWGNFSAPRMYQQLCVWQRERERAREWGGEGELMWWDSEKSFPEFPDWLEERESVSTQSVSSPLPSQNNVWPAWFLLGFNSPKGGTLVSCSWTWGCLLTENTFQKLWRSSQRNILERILKFQILEHWNWTRS